jgi:PKD repeat protein
MPSKKCRIAKKTIFIFFVAIFAMSLGPAAITADAGTADKITGNIGFDGVILSVGDTPTGSSYMLVDNWGGTWADTEKDPGPDDDLLCWAAAGSNMMEWTGWGFVPGMDNTDDMFQHFQDHWTDEGSLIGYGLTWWFDGTVIDPGDDWASVDVAGGGDYWDPPYAYAAYSAEYWGSDTLQHIDTYLRNGWATGLAIYDGGHAITCWGFNYDPLVNPATDPHDYYLGVWVTDSDDDKGSWTPPDRLRYYDVAYHDGRWYMDNYGGGWFIDGVTALEPFPGNRPVADAGGPYASVEGLSITFDGSGSSDADGDPLQYRWDFDNDGTWDTAWSSSATASHTWADEFIGAVLLEVSDGQLRDVDTADVSVSNAAPVVDAGPDQTVNEGDTVNFSGSFTDSGSTDTHTIEWDFGDGDTASGSLTPSHIYGDNGAYTVALTVTDNDGGIGIDSLTVTVNNVAPAITPFGPFTVDENSPVTLTATATDAGSDDLTFTWVLDLRPTVVTIYYNDGIGPDPLPSPGGTYPFSVTDPVVHTYGDNYVYNATLTVEDDDGGAAFYATTVTVNNVAPIITSATMGQPNEQFILPVVHTLIFEATSIDPGSDDLTFTWDWGDGSPNITTTYYNDGIGPDPYPSPEINPMDPTDAVNHIYSTPGDYTVLLTVTDDDGGVDTTTIPVHVVDVEEALDITNEYIQGLTNSFKGKADKRKAAFDNMFVAIDDMLADEEYNGMIQDLRNNIRGKADGYVDGSSKNDWITDSTAQQEICQKIDDITAYLEYLLSIMP